MTSRSDPSSTWADAALARLYRAEWGRLLALLVGRTRRLDLAEDALSEAFARAAARWRDDGVPPNPAGWLYQTAYRRLVSCLRSEAVAARKVPLLKVQPGWVAPSDNLDDLPDERLHLILLCCHPALSPISRSALALRLVLGTPTAEIARLFMVARPTMAARLTRAKAKIVHAGIPLAAPADEILRARLDDVCQTIYLAFTAGYTPGTGDHLLRTDLAGEAVRLAAILRALAPGVASVDALLALLLIQHARRDARVHADQLVILSEQDRSTWHHAEIQAGLDIIATLTPGQGYAEALRLQALIAAEHARAASVEATDWATIAARYAELEALTGSPIVRLNRAVAIAEVEGPRAGLTALANLDRLIPDVHRLAAVRAELAWRAGDLPLAHAAWRRAIEQCANPVERRHLQARLDASLAATP